MLYITNATAEDSIVGERDFSYYTQDKYTYSLDRVVCVDYQ